MVPIVWANWALSNGIPKPSLPNIIPTPKKSNRDGKPNFDPALLANTLTNRSTEPTNIINVTDMIFYFIEG
jgi:hypothetical protein